MKEDIGEGVHGSSEWSCMEFTSAGVPVATERAAQMCVIGSGAVRIQDADCRPAFWFLCSMACKPQCGD
jgi:hypothetical protein